MHDEIALYVHKSANHTLKKFTVDRIELIAGLGVKGDAHMGEKVKHRFIAKRHPEKPNLGQVHLIHNELFDELRSKKLFVNPGDIGENITTSGIDLLSLPENTILHIGSSCKIKITGLRGPCSQLNAIQEGLLNAVLYKEKGGKISPKAGIMSVVIEGGIINTGDPIIIIFPELPHKNLSPV